MDLFFTAVAAVMLYLHSLRDFAREVTTLGGERLRRGLRQATENRFVGALTGAVGAALVQSSSVVNFVTMGLAEQKVMTMRQAWTVMIGANIGTTVTAWLIAFKFTGMGPMLVTLGGLWSLMGPRDLRPYGRPVFHFGLIFLALGLISSTLLPLAQTPEVLAWRDKLSTPVHALVFGTVLTMLVQSSAVVVGLTVLSVASGLLDPTLSIWVVVGANLGTGWVAFINASALGPFARRLASFNCCLDLAGLALFVTVLQFAIRPLLAMIDEPGLQVAFVHSAFNLSAAALALTLLPWLWRYLERYVPKSESGVSG